MLLVYRRLQVNGTPPMGCFLYAPSPGEVGAWLCWVCAKIPSAASQRATSTQMRFASVEDQAMSGEYCMALGYSKYL